MMAEELIKISIDQKESFYIENGDYDKTLRTIIQEHKNKEKNGNVLQLKSVQDICDGAKNFYIADYQRGYRWGKDEVEALLNDIYEVYKKDDSPYIDYEGGMYYEYGDHYYPDGARCEGLISSYYLAKKTGQIELAKEILESCKKAAMCQFHLFNSEKSNFAHKNWEKSQGSIRFKATRQWVRVDSIQHVACFFIRLYWTKHEMKIKSFLDKLKQL